MALHHLEDRTESLHLLVSVAFRTARWALDNTIAHFVMYIPTTFSSLTATALVIGAIVKAALSIDEPGTNTQEDRAVLLLALPVVISSSGPHPPTVIAGMLVRSGDV